MLSPPLQDVSPPPPLRTTFLMLCSGKISDHFLSDKVKQLESGVVRVRVRDVKVRAVQLFNSRFIQRVDHVRESPRSVPFRPGFLGRSQLLLHSWLRLFTAASALFPNQTAPAGAADRACLPRPLLARIRDTSLEGFVSVHLEVIWFAGVSSHVFCESCVRPRSERRPLRRSVTSATTISQRVALLLNSAVNGLANSMKGLLNPAARKDEHVKPHGSICSVGRALRHRVPAVGWPRARRRQQNDMLLGHTFNVP